MNEELNEELYQGNDQMNEDVNEDVNEDELTIYPGDVINVYDESDEGW